VTGYWNSIFTNRFVLTNARNVGIPAGAHSKRTGTSPQIVTKQQSNPLIYNDSDLKKLEVGLAPSRCHQPASAALKATHSDTLMDGRDSAALHLQPNASAVAGALDVKVRVESVVAWSRSGRRPTGVNAQSGARKRYPIPVSVRI
jgi:hypothetical protein